MVSITVIGICVLSAYQGQQIAAEGEEQPGKQDDEGHEEHQHGGSLPGLPVDGLDHCLITIHETLDHRHVLHVGTVEHIDDVAHEERYHAQQDIPQGIVQHGQRQRYAPEDMRREIHEGYDAQQCYGIAPPRYDADEGIQVVSVHIARQALHGLIYLVAPQPFPPLVFHLIISFRFIV